MTTVLGFFRMVFTCLFSVVQILAPAVLGLNPDKYFDDWNAQQQFSVNGDYCINMRKDPDKDFVVLNLADVQMHGDESYGEMGDFAKATIKKLVDEQKPDLITLTGDNAWSTMAYIDLIQFMESLEIPWAPVMGNHDGQGCINEFCCAYYMYDAPHCLFRFGPKDMGYGNYIINIVQTNADGKEEIIHTLYMMDSHSGAGDTKASAINIGKDANGKDAVGYDHFWANQIEWYKWAVNGNTAANGGEPVESSVIMHIPVYEYRTAEKLYCNDLSTYNENGEETYHHYVVKDEYKETCFGETREAICSAEGNNGFFGVAKDLESTKNMLCGHEHVNNMSVVYEGIRLTYTVKLGQGCYWNDDMNGGTTLTIDGDGVGTVEHHYVKF